MTETLVNIWFKIHFGKPIITIIIIISVAESQLVIHTSSALAHNIVNSDYSDYAHDSCDEKKFICHASVYFLTTFDFIAD